MNPSSPRELALPADALIQLRRSLREETDPLSAIHALHTAGYASADEFWRLFARDADPRESDGGTFWTRLAELFARRGWGRLHHSERHPGIGTLTSTDWAEADSGTESQPSCAFSAGLLSGLLTEAAGGGVAVLETHCRSRGDAECRFCYGSEQAIHDLYGLLLDGHSLEDALGRL